VEVSGIGGGRGDIYGGDGWPVEAWSSYLKDKIIINQIMLRFQPICFKTGHRRLKFQ
jgi:hypothetical protein